MYVTHTHPHKPTETQPIEGINVHAHKIKRAQINDAAHSHTHSTRQTTDYTRTHLRDSTHVCKMYTTLTSYTTEEGDTPTKRTHRPRRINNQC